MSADPKIKTPDEIAAQIMQEIASCKSCRGTLTVRVKHGTVYITDSDDEIDAAYHAERCTGCQSRIAAALEQKDGRIRDLEQKRDKQVKLCLRAMACSLRQREKLALERQANKELLEALAALRLNAVQLGDFMYGAVRECSQDMICLIDAALSKHGGKQ